MTTYTWLWSDAAYGTVVASVAAGATSASVQEVQNLFPTPTSGQAFTVVFNPNLAGLPDNATTERITVLTNPPGNAPLTFATALVYNHYVGENVVLVADAVSLAGLQTPLDPGSLVNDRIFLR